MNFFKKNIISIVLIILFFVFVIISYLLDYKTGEKIFNDKFLIFIKEMFLFLPLIFILIGLADVWISREKAEKYIGKESGFKGSLIMILMSTAQVGPLYAAFPVAYLLWKKGSSIRNIFIYIGAFCTLKIPMLTFEISFLGWKFSVLRTVFSIPLIFIIAILMEKYLKNKNFIIKKN